MQLVERVANLIEDLVTTWSETVHASRLRALGLRCPKPPAPSHARQYRVQSTGAQMIAMVGQLLQHPLAVDAMFVRVVQDVDLPKREQELPDDRIAHSGGIIARPVRSRYPITRLEALSTPVLFSRARFEVTRA